MPEEYISRAEALEAANEWVSEACMAPVMRVSRLLDKLQKVPAADVAPVVRGRWVIRFDGPYRRRRCYCSHCEKHNGVGGIAQNQEKPYCPNCGARMDGGDDRATD